MLSTQNFGEPGQPATLSHALFPQQTLVRHAALVLAASLFISLVAQMSISLPIGPVPISGLTFGILLVGALLGPWLGATAAVTYLAWGIVGLPVFAAGASGWAVMTGSTGGYLLGAPLAAFVVGWLSQLGWDRRPWTLGAAMLIGEVVIYACGLPLLYLWGSHHPELIQTTMTWNLTLQWGLFPFIPGDAAKLLLAASLVPAGWQVLHAAQVGPARVLSGDPPSSMNLASLGVLAGLAMAASAVLPWGPSGIGLGQGAGWTVLGAGLAGALGGSLRMRGYLQAAVAQIWAFVAASTGGLVALLHVVTFTAEGQVTLAGAALGPVVGTLAALALLAFAIAETGRDPVASE
ncbi:MAG: biotin transporter BioY [Nitriliruptoraceae bacterium]